LICCRQNIVSTEAKLADTFFSFIEQRGESSIISLQVNRLPKLAIKRGFQRVKLHLNVGDLLFQLRLLLLC
jgi:hypothetical protein